MSAPPAPEVPEAADSTRPTGEAAAAMLAGGVGLLTLGGANLIGSALGVFEEALAMAGRFFVPGGTQLGAYAGKELVALIAWLGSWALLHRRLRQRQVSLTRTIGVFLASLVVSTLLLWPPIVHALVTVRR
jgi:hypothetical protein